jgi:hypothetical protein
VVGQRVAEGDNWRTVFEIAATGHWLGNHAFDWNSDTDNHIFLHGSEKERARKILITEWAIRDALIQGKREAEAGKTCTSGPSSRARPRWPCSSSLSSPDPGKRRHS